MMHRNLTTSEWTLMALESLMERGQLADWREFARALEGNEQLARDALRVSEYVEDRTRRPWFVCLSCSGFPVLLPAWRAPVRAESWALGLEPTVTLVGLGQ